MKTVKEIEELAERLLKSSKRKLIAGNFESIKDLTDEQIKHFKTAEYIWNLTPQTVEGPYKDKLMGLLIDESLEYVHLVFGSQSFLNGIDELKGR